MDFDSIESKFNLLKNYQLELKLKRNYDFEMRKKLMLFSELEEFIFNVK